MKLKLHYDLAIGACLLLLMAFLYCISNTFVYAESTAIFPKITIVIIASLSSVVFAGGIKKTFEASRAAGPAENSPPFFAKYGKPLLVYVLFIAYLLAFYFVNFFVATAVMLAGMMHYFGVRDWKPLILVPAGFLAVSYFVFVQILSVKLL